MTVMTILAPHMILNLRREYCTSNPVNSTTAPSSDATLIADRSVSTTQASIQELGIGIWSAEMGGYVTSRRIGSKQDNLEE